jgi:hypothetical protein
MFFIQWSLRILNYIFPSKIDLNKKTNVHIENNFVRALRKK